MAHEPHHDHEADFQELVREVRNLIQRVERLEQRLDEESADTSPGGDQSSEASRPASPVSSATKSSALESRIGLQWLNRIGVVAILLGASYLLRYAFLSNWISAAAWIWLGVGAGAAIIVSSECFRARGYRVLSLSLKAIGTGVIYLSLWAGFELYEVLSGPNTFSGLLILTAVTAVLALREHAEVLATLALLGAFATPVLISIPLHQGPLFLYVAILDCAAVLGSLLERWWKLLALSLVGTVLLYAIWYFERYTRTELVSTVAAATVFFAIFCLATAWARPSVSSAVRLLTVLSVANPAAYFFGLYLLLDDVSHGALALAAFGLSAIYFTLAWKAQGGTGLGAGLYAPAYGGLGVGLVAVGIAVLFEVHWLSLGWFVEAAGAMAIGFWRDLPWLRWSALLLLCATLVKAFAYDIWELGLASRTISFIGLGILLLVISFAYQRYGFSMMSKIAKGPTSRMR